MSKLQDPFPATWSLGELLQHLGDVDAKRVRVLPYPGRATEDDVRRIQRKEKRLFELVEGVLVEKIMGMPESYLAMLLGHFLSAFVRERQLGFVTGPDGMVRLLPNLIRIPDVAFFSWQHFPDHKVPKQPISDVAPDLAVEVLSVGNTAKEMEQKLRDYFDAGSRLVWLVDPSERTVRTHVSPNESTLVGEHEALDGGTVLPGFSLPLRDLFAELEAEENPK